MKTIAATLPLSSLLGAEVNNSEKETMMRESDQSPLQRSFSNTMLGVNLFSFDGNGPGWFPVNDGVMGGISTSSVVIDSERHRLLFSGNLSLENNGGFASIRSHWTPLDLSGYEGIALRVLGDGKIYRFRIVTEETGPEIAYTALFATKKNTWQDIYIPFAEMIPIYRGVAVKEAGSINPASIRSFGLMLADKQQGEFSLEVDQINVIATDSVPENVEN
jgi:NADH dehydrogenase [ubiquinone] 1 alpha subcomplex assembly factor 1